MPRVSKKKKSEVVPRSLLKQSGVKVGKERGNYVFVIPVEKAEELTKQFGFSFDQLKVGGDIPLAELAVHIDEHASVEANASLATELCRYALEKERNKYELWHEQTAHKCRMFMIKKHGISKVTAAMVAGYTSTKYGSKISERRKKITDLEFQYRLLNNVFLSALKVKGMLLPTLRNIVQGKADIGIGIKVKVGKRVRSKLNIKT